MSLTTEFQKIDNKVVEKNRQQEALLYLGQLALSEDKPANLMAQVAELFRNALRGDYSLIWEFQPGMENLLLVANTGLGNGSEDGLQIQSVSESLEGFTLTSESPVIIHNILEDTRFKPLSMVLEHGAVCGAGIRIGGLAKPYGVIEVFSRQVQDFLPDDIHFLQNIAQIVSIILHNQRREESLVKENQQLKKELATAQSVTRSGHFQWDRYDIKQLLIESRERERLRLAQELHDVPIQDLYGLIYQLDDLKDALDDSQGRKIVDECELTLQRTVNSLRTICRELRPPSLSPFGLEVAIRDHVEKFMDQNPDITVQLDLMHDQQILSDSLRLSLFRVYQQAIHNVARHAQATEVHVRFRWDEEMILLEIEDNGEGFEVPKNWIDLVRDEHFGLLGIAERVDSIHGKLEILSALGDGTLIRAIVPRHSG
jgi:signal transduction histidine kinase